VNAPLGATRFWFMLAGGELPGPREVVIADQPQTTTRFTFDDSPVTETSLAVTGPLTLTHDATIRARVYSAAAYRSPETVAVFTSTIPVLPAESFVSPAYMEILHATLDGSPALVSLSGPSGTTNGFAIINHRFILRYPLQVNEPTPVTLSRTTLPDLSTNIVWREIDLAASSLPDPMTIRAGDSLLFTAGVGETGTLHIAVMDGSNQVCQTREGVTGEKLPVRFDQGGTFTVIASVDGISVGSLIVHVVYIDFDGPVACQVGYKREKGVAVYGPTDQVFFTAKDPALLEVSVKEVTSYGVRLYLKALGRGTPVVQARLGSATGPILAEQEVDEFILDTSAVQHLLVNGATDTAKPWIPNVDINFAMYAHFSTFAGGATAYTLNTSDQTSVDINGAPAIDLLVDPTTGETQAVIRVDIEIPADEDSYCFSASFDQHSKYGTVVGDVRCNGKPCKFTIEELFIREGDLSGHTLTNTADNVNTNNHPSGHSHTITPVESTKFSVTARPTFNCKADSSFPHWDPTVALTANAKASNKLSVTICNTTFSNVVIVLKVDIDPVQTNVCWQMTNAVLNLTTNSYWAPEYSGSMTWSSTPTGLSGSGSGGTFTFNPNALTSTSYVVTARSTLLTNCYDTCTVNVYRVELRPKATNVCWQTTTPVEIVLTNSYAPGGITWSGTNGLKVVSATDAKLVFTPTNSTATNYAVKATATGFPNCYDVCTVNVYRVELTPDATNVCWLSSDPVEIVLTNSYAPGGITWSGTNGLKVVSATDVKLVFTPTNSTPTNYAVTAAATGFPNCFDTATVNVYRVELTPDATNVCWQTTNPVEIVLTNSYAPGGITWSGTNGLKVFSATDVKLVFTPTNSTPTNYAVKAASAGFPNCYDVCTVNVYRVELTPKATNVCWQTTAPVEIVLTNSYAPGGITWSGTNGLKVVSATDAKLVFTPTNSTPTNYAVKAAATGFPICYDVCTVNVWKVDIVQTNLEAHVYCTNCTPFNLTADSWTNVTWSMSPDLGTNGAQFIAGTTWTGSGGTNTWHGTNVWVYSGPVSNKYTLTARAVELISCYDTATLEVLKPEFVDLNWLEATNEILHHTSLYQTNALVLRRSDKFKVDAKLSKGYTNTCFNVWFQAVQNFDGTPKTNDVPVVTADLGLTDWYCKLLSTSDNADQTTTAHMEINIPSTNCPIGEYQWRALVVPKAATNVVLDTTNFPGQVIILFNPWSSNDSVHMANDADRQEYVMRTSGIMWTGSRTRKTTKTWQYAQFDTDSIGVLLSELVGQNTSARMDPILVSRHFSARVNCNGGGILWGLWPTNNVWPGGTNASYWAGSVEIFNQYRSTGNPVKYGQCWVFGGLLTSMLRSSGIPSRPLTTYNSGHDANANKIIEHYYRTDGSYDKIRSEGIWNFHVWCEAWMTRPDRPGHDGWQAVDATPQEISAGAYQCGPASHVAVQGNLGGNYDVDFVYAEVSADFQRWEDTPGGGMVLVNTLVDRVGHDISTKSVGADTLHDITAEYK
jgi:hypothetical protein